MKTAELLAKIHTPLPSPPSQPPSPKTVALIEAYGVVDRVVYPKRRQEVKR